MNENFEPTNINIEWMKTVYVKIDVLYNEELIIITIDLKSLIQGKVLIIEFFLYELGKLYYSS